MNVVNFIVNNWDSILAVGGVLGIWGHKKAKGIKLDDLWETLLKMGRQAFTQLLDDARLYDDAYVRAVIGKVIRSGLSRLEVPETAAIAKLIDEAVEHIHGELAEQVMKYHLGRLKTVTIPALEGAAQKLATAAP